MKLTIVFHPFQKNIINFQKDMIPTQNLYDFLKNAQYQYHDKFTNH
jgi:hypothetical protein